MTMATSPADQHFRSFRDALPAATTWEAVARGAETAPHAFALRVIERGGAEAVLTRGDLATLAAAGARALAAAGIAVGDRIVLALPASRLFLALHLGAGAIGALPVVVAPPAVPVPDPARAHLADIARRAGARLLVAEAEPAAALDGLDAQVTGLSVAAADRLLAAGLRAALPAMTADPQGISHLQQTSGSTGAPKLAVVHHDRLSANLAQIAAAICATPQGVGGDVLVSWLPLSHDMGLVGLNYALRWGVPMVLADTGEFVRNPMNWPAWMSRHKGTLSPAPNSAFQMCARLARLRPPRGLDLSAWRVALCGAEPVHARTLQDFSTAFGSHGFAPQTLRPVYGLAEATLAVAIPPVGGCVTDPVDADRLAAEGLAAPAGDDAERRLHAVTLGPAVPGAAIRITAPDGTELPERRVGEIEVASPATVGGYWQDPAESARLTRPDGWLRTGDLGYLADGRLHVTGRAKDLLILGGRNFTPAQIEDVAEAAADAAITPAVIAVGLTDETLGTETLHLLLDTRLGPEEARAAIAQRIRDALAEAFGLTGIGTHWIAAGLVPRTPSGKVQRFRCREIVAGRLADRQAAASKNKTTPAPGRITG